ncbi:MAG: hypothetical protein MJZ36_01420 [Bacteroidaceae bacterium]|nr:hypothetical protein [Bacteroidaceae bacterium]
MNKKELLNGESQVEYHEHNAPVYNINIGYVNKQINGVYYEIHGSKSDADNDNNCSQGEGKRRGATPTFLFIKQNDPSSENTVARKAAVAKFTSFLKDHSMSGRQLTSKQGDTLNDYVVCFWMYWHEKKMVADSPKGAAIYRFLTNDCGLSSSVSERTYSNWIVKAIQGKNYTMLSLQSVRNYMG